MDLESISSESMKGDNLMDNIPVRHDEMMDIEMKTEIQQNDNVGLEFSVPQTIIAKKLVPINARVFDTSLDANLSHTDWSYAVTNSGGHVIHKSTTLHGHFGIMNFKDSFPEPGTYTIQYTTLSSGSFMLGAPVPELGQTRSVVTGDILRFEEDPKNNFGSRTFEFTVNVSEPEQTVIIEGSEPDAAYLVNLYTQPARILSGEPVTIVLDVDDYYTGKDATHVDGLISIIPQHYYQSDSGDQPDFPVVLHGAYHGHLGVMSTTQIFPKSGTVLLEIEFKSIPYSKPSFGHGSTQFAIQVFDSADTYSVILEEIAKENTVEIVGIESPFYTPNTITVSAGETIVFDNVDPNYHTVTSVKPGTIEHDGKFDSGLLNAGQTYELTIDEQGTYDYFCSLHIGMKGIVIVS
jgi:plastocyanin